MSVPVSATDGGESAKALWSMNASMTTFIFSEQCLHASEQQILILAAMVNEVFDLTQTIRRVDTYVRGQHTDDDVHCRDSVHTHRNRASPLTLTSF